MSSTYQHLSLQDWLWVGEQTGRVTLLQLIELAYSMDEREAAAWIADIVQGRISEAEAVVFMERVIQYRNRYYH